MRPLARRAALGGAAAAAAAAVTTGTAPANATTGGPRSFTVVDNRGRQRFRLDSRKPPLIIDGRTIPAEQRSGPDHGSYFVFNDENGDEKGGLLVHQGGGHLTFDYPHARDGISIGLSTRAGAAGAGLTVNAAPDPASGEQGPAKTRVLLGCRSDFGAVLNLCDSAGRPRIVLKVDEHDRPSISILDGDGKVVHQLG